ncbi:hypothetical protein OKE80_02440 [Riemerella anatipestifer]|uniref:hypothetical protein n=1 Tax=Riemerella anatipestifer TaxID=34085 RepID=UPI0012ADE523|nr:hypothetical protein [Riemerella anatipestifer]MCO7318278.1 hypothetical protein [Riemerella anatipestifer]MCQ4154490.1 hypothetical protein [Riemerella anatipestifer]MCQ4180518.1 hypothetical protein [Riemerella anatipestifer]MCW0473689.1 hypothetical protein [Riemerella anatipestifer]MDR7774621.1 hypothetical protein [Riemerella anatipestifer]
MKKILLALFFIAAITVSKAQSILGKYEQSTLVAPNEYRDSENDVVITKDAKSLKKIWIANLIPNQRIFAILHTKGNGNIIYSVPKQLAGNYRVNMGCVTFKEHDDDDDGEEGKLIISLNNKNNCFGLNQKDYDAPVSIGKGGIKAGGVTVGSNGTISTGSVDIKRGNIKVNPKEVMAGIQYIGYKK